jgi:hypothetical protein
MGKTITLNFDHLSPSDRKILTAVAARAEKNRKRIERNREVIRRLKNSNDSQKNIAKDFGITKQAVSLIKRAGRITRTHARYPGARKNRRSRLRASAASFFSPIGHAPSKARPLTAADAGGVHTMASALARSHCSKQFAPKGLFWRLRSTLECLIVAPGSWFVKSTARCASQLSRPRPAAEPN